MQDAEPEDRPVGRPIGGAAELPAADLARPARLTLNELREVATGEVLVRFVEAQPPRLRLVEYGHRSCSWPLWRGTRRLRRR